MGRVETVVDDVSVARHLGICLGLEAPRVYLTGDTRPIERRLKDVTASGAPLAHYVEVPIDAPPPSLKLASEDVDSPVRSPLADGCEKAPAQLAEWQAKLSKLQGGSRDAKEIVIPLRPVTRLALRADRMDRYRSKRRLAVETQAIRIGGLRWSPLRASPIVKIGVAAKQKSPSPNRTLVAGYLGGDMMYIPTAEAFEHNSPPMQVDNSRYTPEAEKITADHLLRLLECL